jgi:starch synthase
MKCAIKLSDAVSTVSHTYAKEIKEFNGRGMESVLNSRQDDVYGILNGIDYDYWNPSTDKNIKENYSKDSLQGKALCKADLQKICGFEIKKDAYMLGCLSRLDEQKGFDIIIDAFYKLTNADMQFKVAAFFDYNESLARKIYADYDAFKI